MIIHLETKRPKANMDGDSAMTTGPACDVRFDGSTKMGKPTEVTCKRCKKIMERGKQSYNELRVRGIQH